MRAGNKPMPDAARSTRNSELVSLFGEYMRGSVLDVGCHECDLRRWVPEPSRYFGIDIAGKPDQVVDLETGVLPFCDGLFDCVVASDVLEHLEALHDIFDECLRVSSRYVIVTLPNSAAAVKRACATGGDMPRNYGLPREAVLSRHRWLFNWLDAFGFVFELSLNRRCQLVDDHTPGAWDTWWKRLLVPEIWRRKNIWATGFWAVLEKRP
jgi:SAM-dependent methyltransferase